MEPRANEESVAIGWYGPQDWSALGVEAEIQAWCTQALQAGLDDRLDTAWTNLYNYVGNSHCRSERNNAYEDDIPAE